MKGDENLMNAQRRLINDLKQFKKNDDNDSVMASPHDDNLMIWDGIIFGPDDTPWEGGIFKLTLTFTEDYPKKPPQVKMETPVFHPNFYVDGRICLDILQNQWSPIIDVYTVLTSIQSLLTDPNPLSPANVEAAKLYTDNIQEYLKKVKQCVEESTKE